MIKYILLFLFIACFLVLGPMFADKQGLIHIEFLDYVVETSLVTAIILFVVGCLVFWLCQALIKKLINSGKSASGWLNKRRDKNARNQLEQSLLSYIEGDYQTSFNQALKSNERSVAPVVSAVMTAVAGLKNGNDEACEALLKEAKARGDDDTCRALNLLRIKGHLGHGRFQAAYALASVLYNQDAKNHKINELMLVTAKELNKVEDVLSIATKALKQKVLTKEQVLSLVGAFIATFIGQQAEASKAQEIVAKLPSQLRYDPLIVNAFAQRLCLLHEEVVAAKLVINELKQDVSSDLIYSGIASWSVGNETLLKYLEKQFTGKKASDPKLMAALANMLLHKGEINKARDLYEQLAQTTSNKRVLLNLAGIYEAQGNYKDAAHLYKKANVLKALPQVW